MATLERRAAELNEVGWWAHWGEVKWIGRDSYVLTSKELTEPFFNRAGFLSCEAIEKSMPHVEGFFQGTGRIPHLTVFDSCENSAAGLRASGYAQVDTMVVQQAGKKRIPPNREVDVRQIGVRDVATWSETYLHSFYGELSLRPQVARVVKGLAGVNDATLLAADVDGVMAGVTALYRTPGLLGLYCLGTLPRYRGRGVARSLLSRAQQLSLDEGRELILQSLASEETEPYYSKFGFKRLYVKEFLRMHAAPRVRPVTVEVFGTTINRVPGVGSHPFTRMLRGFENVVAVKDIFGDRTQTVLSSLPVEVVDEEGYMHINPQQGSIVASAEYLREGNETHLYLDIIHELVHIRQHMEGRELWDRRFKYVDRPTEIEAYMVAVAEARRIGLTDDRIAEYLKVEWVNVEDFKRFLKTLGVRV